MQGSNLRLVAAATARIGGDECPGFNATVDVRLNLVRGAGFEPATPCV
jgi:hypothetical protein